MTPRPLLVAALAAVALGPAPAAAAREHIALLCDAPSDLLCGRLLAELRSTGYRVDLLPPLSDLNAELAAPGAVLQVQRAPRSVLVWFRKQGVVEARAFTPEGKGEEAEHLLTVQVAEGLRAVFVNAEAADPVDLLEPPPTPAPEPAPAQPEAAPAPAKPSPGPPAGASVAKQDPGPRLSLAAAPGVAWSPGGASAFATLTVAGGLGFGRVAGLELSADLPLCASTLQVSDGTAALYPFRLGLSATARLQAGWFSLQGGAGLAALVLHVAHGSGQTLGAAMPFAGLTMGFEVAPRLFLRLGVEAGVALPEPALVFDGESSGWFGSPQLSANLGVEVLL